jgi:YegS/Rv2252/BmrU family lipid kinase
MKLLSKKWLVILNPTSGQGSSQKKWPKIKQLLDHYGFQYQLEITQYPKHSIRIVHDYIEKGFRHFICIGGDGTLHNIVNGIMSQNITLSQNIHVGIIPIGTGNDWVKTHHISNVMESAIKTILKGNLQCQDIGKIEIMGENLKPVYFNNMAGIGFDAYVVSKVNTLKKVGKFSYLLGAMLGLFSFKNFNCEVYINSKLQYSGKVLMVLVGLCKYSGGGMQLTKNPNAFDGVFDVSIAKNLSKFEIIKKLGHLFNGKITNHLKVESLQTHTIEIKPTEKALPFIQADGELLGKGNFKISIIEKAFSFYAY